MSVFDCDVTRTGVRVIGDAEAKRLIIGALTLDVQTAPLFVSAETVAGTVRVAFAGSDDVARLVAVGDTIEVLGPTAGIRNVLVTTRAVYWVDRSAKDYWTRTWDGTRTKKPIPLGNTSQGIAYEAADGKLRWADEFQRAPVVIHGQRFHDPYVDGLWTFGTTSNNRVIAWRLGGKVLDCKMAGNNGPRGREMVDGSAIVAANRYGKFSTSASWVTLALPPPIPPPTPPANEDDMDTAQFNALVKLIGKVDEKVDRVLDALDDIPPPPQDDDDDVPQPAPEQPVIPIESVTWLGKASPLGFAVTSHISAVTIVKRSDDTKSAYKDDNWIVCFPHSKAGQWPAHTNAQGKKYEGNVCVFGRVNSRWYADTAEWLEVNQTCKRLTNRPEPDSWGIGPHTKHEPLKSWGPKSGEWIGIMVCTPVREGVEGDVHERSNIYLVRWP